ncbi:glycoside hydrolase family 13 protein [Mycoplasma sp. HU2014]|uniref:glycoside hydrolase family 13 protein n=1 Tax=Mycoplasma sp. HU2014 TaxID=1664275 RepID=UPI00067E1FB2|nr:glycoside hydrolase family 13 protein [Mycoplasma sp. HU2014]KNG79000.1 cyclomaltodextrinase/alpha-amylase family protein [Mycoplasma sp. HU2014]
MDKLAIYHKDQSNYSFALSNKQVVLRLRVSKNDSFDYIKAIYGVKYGYQVEQKEIDMSVKYTDKYFNYYEVLIDIDDVRFVYIFKLKINNEIYYYSEEGLTKEYDFSKAFYSHFQIPYIHNVDTIDKIDWVTKSIFYQIFVDRFNMGSDKLNKDYINLNWGDIPKGQYDYAGGDLKGIIEKLDYLKDLGITSLYLTPIFLANTNHKYDTVDFYKIDDQFGDKKIFKKLVDECHKRDMKIVLDMVFNHGSDKSKEFKHVLKHKKKSKYFDYFMINGDEVDQEKINYEVFAHCSYHPKFNTENKKVRKYLIKVAKYYKNKFNIDGVRLDVSDEVSLNFWFHFREQLKKIDRNFFIFGENWHDAHKFLQGDKFDSIMNYSVTKAILDLLAYNNLDSENFVYRLNELVVRNTTNVNLMMINLIDSHDTNRFITDVDGDVDKLLLALSIIFIYIGVPMIYYGTEIKLDGGYDPLNRKCFNWGQVNKDEKYTSILKQLINLKHNQDSLIKGDIQIKYKDNLIHITRTYNDEKIKLIINYNNTDINYISKDLILSNNYHNNILKHKGFIIEK